jgi:hypothetical protein
VRATGVEPVGSPDADRTEMRAAGLEPVRTMSPDTGRDADTAG